MAIQPDQNILDITKPTTEEEWQREFERYKTFPEYEEVKKIFGPIIGSFIIT